MKPTAILVSDLHIRETIPECRKDDFMLAQERKYAWLRELQTKYDVPILVAGDVFHHWKPSPWLIGWTLRNLPDGIIAIPGQHDLTSHNLDMVEKTGIYVLAEAGKIELLTDSSVYNYNELCIQGFPWGVELTPATPCKSIQFPIALVHKLVYKGTPPFPGAENVGGTGKALLKSMSGFDLILTGDNHQTFTETLGESILVNPGSFTRQTAAQVDHQPSVFLWFAEDNTVEQVFVPINDAAVSREHLIVAEERDERIDAFVTSLNKTVDLGISFEENMIEILAKNTVPKEVHTIIQGVLKDAA